MISESIKKKKKQEKRQTRDGAEQVSSLRSCPLSPPSSPSLKGEGVQMRDGVTNPKEEKQNAKAGWKKHRSSLRRI